MGDTDEQLLEMFGPGNVPKKATQQEVGMLPVTSVTEATLKSMQDRGDLMDCSVCLEPFVTGDEVKRLPCLHIFHVSCIDKWLKECE